MELVSEESRYIRIHCRGNEREGMDAVLIRAGTGGKELDDIEEGRKKIEEGRNVFGGFFSRIRRSQREPTSIRLRRDEN